jgi:hypothetical protein
MTPWVNIQPHPRQQSFIIFRKTQLDVLKTAVDDQGGADGVRDNGSSRQGMGEFQPSAGEVIV